MSATTSSAIRDLMISTVAALIPSTISQNRYRPHRDVTPFVDFCEKTANACIRLFSIRDTFERTPPTISNMDVEEITSVFECRIAYPKDFRYGNHAALDMDATMDGDLRQVRNAIGVNGYATLEGSVGTGSAAVFEETPTIERGQAVDFIVLRLRTLWKESV